MDNLFKKFEFKDKEYSVVAITKEHFVEFYVYENEEDLDYLFSGSVKWDGCSYWDFKAQNGRSHPLYFCNKESAVDFGVLLGKLYDWVGELIKVLTDEEIEKW